MTEDSILRKQLMQRLEDVKSKEKSFDEAREPLVDGALATKDV